VKEKDEEERDKVNVPSVYEMEWCMGSHWLNDWLGKEECECDIHRQVPIQGTIDARTQGEEEAMEMKMGDTMGLGQGW
jgi:hypothetical protein